MGALSAVGTVQGNLTVILVTGAVCRFGTAALAGYGLASRLDASLIPPLFGLGTAVVTLVGTNVGAGQFARARRVAWTGALVGAGFAESIGLVAAGFPHGWLGLITREPAVLAAGGLYLRTVAPFYGCVGLGLIQWELRCPLPDKTTGTVEPPNWRRGGEPGVEGASLCMGKESGAGDG